METVCGFVGIEKAIASVLGIEDVVACVWVRLTVEGGSARLGTDVKDRRAAQRRFRQHSWRSGPSPPPARPCSAVRVNQCGTGFFHWSCVGERINMCCVFLATGKGWNVHVWEVLSNRIPFSGLHTGNWIDPMIVAASAPEGQNHKGRSGTCSDSDCGAMARLVFMR